MRAHLGLGSNLGDRGAAIALGRRQLESDGLTVVGASEVEETTPVGVLDQPRFLNQVLLVETDLAPGALLALCKRIEEVAGRRPGGVRWGPRELDIDILLVGDELLDEPGLRVPHPELLNRDFVRRQLAQVSPGLRHPLTGELLWPT
ncbi:MAG: 2-amino-4-hydroxy-6-hydroxymethyldihydropteridine diphosphokinase [Candidatus Dormibacteria bacterium]